MQVISRSAALELGLKRYFTGKPCKYGHICERYAKTKVCAECSILQQRKRRQENLEAARAYHRQWARDNKDLCKASKTKFLANNPDALSKSKAKYRAKEGIKEQELAYSRRYRQENLEACRERSRSWNKRHPRSIAAHASARRARVLQAQPSWVCSDQLAEIFQSCPVGYHIDHVVPLKHKLVCGLHVAANLEAIPAEANQRKLNYFDPDEWSYDVTTFTFVRTTLPGAPDYFYLMEGREAWKNAA